MIDVDGIKTYSNSAALAALTELARHTPPDTAIVEVGVYRGGSLRTIAKAAHSPVYGVDTWGLEGAYRDGNENPGKYGIDNMRIAQTAVHGLGVTLIRAFSADAAARYDGPPIGLLYIDAEHTGTAVLADYAAWRVHLAADATVAFDDYNPAHADLAAGIDEIVQCGQLTMQRVVGGRLAVCATG